ncbi:hypothetical protein [Thalassotalea sediminis]|uniref:hypothetical protein n=1 Tax=Thalassotalea sediminis TaxID=1759089 RepID=UPI0025740AA2|nr:hypothetical protein [Thalassotalea sediminis]
MTLHQNIDESTTTETIDELGGIIGYQIAYSTRKASPMKTYRDTRTRDNKKLRQAKDVRRQSRTDFEDWH